MRMVQIANPIYDVVFKYLMNDKKVAKLLLSAIIGREVVDLEFRPTEHHFPVGELLAVFRMDFSARILDEQGREELVILELQKAKLASDIMRFRRYLGEQYANKENVVREPRTEYPFRKALPILSIYFLGHRLDHVKAPVVRVNRRYIDAATGERIHEKEELPERYQPLLRRLQKAVADPVILQTMDAEDDLIEEFKEYQRMITEKERMISEKERMISEKERMIEERDKTLEEKEKAIEEKEQTIEAAILRLHSAGTGPERLAEIFGLPVEGITTILNRKGWKP